MENAIIMTKSAITYLLFLLSLAGRGVDSQESLLDELDRQRRPMDCFKANETCFNTQASTSCRNSIMVLYSVCGRSWKYCDSANIHFCRSHLGVVRTSTVFRGCVCYDSSARYRQCDNLWKLLNQNPCERNPVPRRPPGAADSDVVVDKKGFTTDIGPPEQRPKKRPEQESLRTQLERVGVKPDSGKGPSCLTVMRNCQDSGSCQSLRDDFVKQCRYTACERNSDACLYTYEHIRLFHVFNCTCMGIPMADTEGRIRCQRFRSQFVENKCLALMNSQTLYGFNLSKKTPQTGDSSMPVKTVPRPPPARPEAPSGGPFGSRTTRITSAVKPPVWSKPKREPENCVNVYRDCVQGTMNCLVRLISMSESCHSNPISGRGCQDHRRCMSALADFYSGQGSLARRALICNCRDDDRDCNAKRAMLRPSCAYDETAVTCLSLIDKCFSNKECQPRYQLFADMCNDDDISDDKCPHAPEKCLDAHRALWGTNLTQRCSCHISGVPINYRMDPAKLERYLKTCKKIQRLLRDPPCLQGKYDVARTTAFVSRPKAASKTVEERRNAACRSRLSSGVREAEIRLYHNDSCSDLCTCTHLGQVRCRVLPCSDTRPCRPSAAHRDSKCQCVFGELVCPPAPTPLLMEGSPPGFYLSVGFSPTERRLLSHPDMGNMSHVLTWVLNSTTRGITRLCQLQLESQTASSALYRVRLVERRSAELRTSRTVMSECDYPIRLLRLMIEAGDPAIRSHPHLSLIRQARILNSAPRYNEAGVDGGRRKLPVPGRIPANTNHHGGAAALAPGVGLMLACCLLAWRRVLGAA